MPHLPQSLPEYFAERATSTEDHRVLAFPLKPDQRTGLTYFTNQDIRELVLKATAYYLKLGLSPALQDDTIIGLSAPGTIEWCATFIALSRLGYTILVLTPNLSPEALAGLIEKSGCLTLITGTGLDKETWTRQMNVVPMISTEALKASRSSELQDSYPSAQVPTTAYIGHSSGSTGLPKLFHVSQPAAMARIKNTMASPYGHRSLSITSALYNSAGLIFVLIALSKSTTTFFSNDRLPWSGPGLIDFLSEAKPNEAIFSPPPLEMVVSAPGGLAMLKQIPIVSNFGAVCPQALGDTLVTAGVRFHTAYAMSETASLMSSAARPPNDLDWDFMSPIPVVTEHLWMKSLEIQSEEMEVNKEEFFFEAVILKGLPNCPPSMSNSDNPPGSFYTGDVFLRHPTKENRWKLVGRKDDQIKMGVPVLVTVNALEYENMIKSATTDLVAEVVIFGQGRKKLGVLIFVKEGVKTEDAMDMVERTIEERINGKMKMGVGKDMIIRALGSVPRTDKGNFMRAAVYLRYKQLIDKAYEH